MSYLLNPPSKLFHIIIIAFAINSAFQSIHNSRLWAQSKDEKKFRCCIRGTIIDSLSGKPVEIANIKATSMEDTEMVYGTISTENGRFEMTNLQSGEYEVRISRLGYRTRIRKKVSLTPENKNLDLGVISLTQESITLDDVMVTAPKPPITFDINKIIMNPMLGNGNNLLEQLENAPFVSINFDGQISIGGMAAIKIYIDGRPASIYGIQQTDDLRSIFFYEIERIEIITGPTSEYPNGTSNRIINIVTKKGLSDKYSANIGGGITSRWNLNVNTDVSVALKSLVIRGDYRNSYSSFPQSSSVIKQYEMNNKITLLEQLLNSDRKNSSNNGNINIIFRPDESNTFSNNVQYGTSFGRNTSIEDGHYSNGDGNYKKSMSGKNDSKSLNYSSSYSGIFKNKITLDAVFAYSKGLNNFENNVQQSNLSTSQNGSSGFSKMMLGNGNDTYTTGIRGRFSLSADMKILLSLDNKYAHVKRNTNYSNSVENDSPGGLVIYPGINYKNNEDIASIGLDGILWKLNYSGNFSIRNYFANNTIGLTNYKYSNVSIDPVLGLGMNITPFSCANIGYSYTSCNPSNDQISPMVINTDTTNIIQGNPQLKPYRVHNITINYSQLIGESFIMLNTSYYNSIGIIEPITQLFTPYVTTTTSRNVGSSVRYETMLSGRTRIFNALDLQPSITFARNKYKSIYAITVNENNSWFSSLQISSSILFLKVQMDLNYSSPTATAQTRYKALFYCNAALRGRFFNNDLSFSLRVIDLFNSMRRNYDMSSQGIYVKNLRREVSRVFSLDVNYFFQSKTI